MRFASTLASACLVVLGSCQAVGSGSGLSDSAAAAIRASSAAWEKAFLAGDWEALGREYTADALLLPPNAPAVRGREAIRGNFAAFPPVAFAQLQIDEIEGAGELAYVVGTYRMTIPRPGMAPLEEVGKYLEVRRRQGDGSWPIAYDMYSSDLPPVQ